MLLTRLYNPRLMDTLWQPPVRSVPEARDVLSGLEKSGACSPFIVRGSGGGTDLFSHITLQSLLSFSRTSDAKVFGYDSSGEIVDGLVVSDVCSSWERDELNYKVLDAPVACAQLRKEFVDQDREPDWGPEAEAENESQPGNAESSGSAPSSAEAPESSSSSSSSSSSPTQNAGLSLLFSRAHSYTFLHLDPPVYGGGWMYLAQGVKSWTFIHPRHIGLLYDPTTRRLRDLPLSRLCGAEFNHALHGVPMHTTARAGDFIYFPPAWMHRVRTYEKCVGVAGYLRLPQAHATMKHYAAELEKRGLSSVWNGNTDI